MTIKIITLTKFQRIRFLGVVLAGGRTIATTHQTFNNRNSAAFAAWQLAKVIQ